MTSKKVAIVTGASRDIGAEIAKKLAFDGFAVVVNYASNQQKADEVVNGIKATAGEAIAVPGDVSNSKDIAHLFDAAEQEFGGVDVLVNNVGGLFPPCCTRHVL
jgi:3-oxoacyl-[acyl-carrier protein] reductase